MEIKSRFDHFNINVTDLERSIAFYEKALGLKEHHRKEAADGSFILVYLTDNTTGFLLELTWLRDHTEAYELGENESHLCFRVAGDYDAVRQYHKEMDCVCFENTSMGLYFINDPAAGGGILHQEMPQPSPRMLGLQLWINLPRDKKMVHPKYRDITPDDIPVIEEKGVTIRVVTGKYGTIGGAVQGEYVDVQFLDVEMGPGAAWEMETIPGNTVFSYLMEGSCAYEPEGVLQPARRAVLFSEGGNIRLHAGPEGARMVIVSGKPLHEPVAWGGPIVMNTDEEVREAFMELEEGTFIRHG